MGCTSQRKRKACNRYRRLGSHHMEVRVLPLPDDAQNVQTGRRVDESKEIECKDKIDEGDLQKLQLEYPDLPDCDRSLIRNAMAYISKQNEYVWKSATFALYGESFTVVLTSGSQANHFAATFDENGQVKSYCAKRGWIMLTTESTRGGAIMIWKTVGEKIVNAIIDLIFGSIGKGLGFKDKKAIQY